MQKIIYINNAVRSCPQNIFVFLLYQYNSVRDNRQLFQSEDYQVFYLIAQGFRMYIKKKYYQ